MSRTIRIELYDFTGDVPMEYIYELPATVTRVLVMKDKIGQDVPGDAVFFASKAVWGFDADDRQIEAKMISKDVSIWMGLQ